MFACYAGFPVPKLFPKYRGVRVAKLNKIGFLTEMEALLFVFYEESWPNFIQFTLNLNLETHVTKFEVHVFVMDANEKIAIRVAGKL